MKLGTSTWVLNQRFGDEEAIRMIAAAGFDGIDWDFSPMASDDAVWNRDDWRDYAHRLRKLADELGVSVLQAHAPYPTAVGKEPHDTVMLERIRRSIEAASILGATHIVVHPMKHLDHVKFGKELFVRNIQGVRKRNRIPRSGRHQPQPKDESGHRAKGIAKAVCA